MIRYGITIHPTQGPNCWRVFSFDCDHVSGTWVVSRRDPDHWAHGRSVDVYESPEAAWEGHSQYLERLINEAEDLVSSRKQHYQQFLRFVIAMQETAP